MSGTTVIAFPKFKRRAPISLLFCAIALLLAGSSLMLASGARAAPLFQQQGGYWQFTGTNTSDTFNESWGPGSSWYPSPDDWSGGGTIDYVSGSNQIQITTDCSWSLSGGEGGTQNLAPGATISVSVSISSSADGRSETANIAGQDSVNAYGFGTNIAHAQDDYNIANGESDSTSSSGSGSFNVPTGSQGATQSIVFTCMVNAGMGITKTEWYYQWVDAPAPAPAPGGSNPPPAPPTGGQPPVDEGGASSSTGGNKGLAGGLAAGGAVAGVVGAGLAAAGIAGAVAGASPGATTGTASGTSTGTAAGTATTSASGTPALAQSLQNLTNDLSVIDKKLTSQGIYVANKLQGDPVLVFQGIEVLGNAIWDKTAGRVTGAQGFTCGDYVNKTIADVKAAVAKNFPGAKVQRVEYDEMSSLNAAGPNPSISDQLDALNAENHTLIKVTLPNGDQYAVDFHQHNASNIQTNPPIMRPYSQARAEWQKYLGQNEFVETVK
jgi:hypothetical protein